MTAREIRALIDRIDAIRDGILRAALIAC